MANASCVGCPHYRRIYIGKGFNEFWVCGKGYCAKQNKSNFKSKKKKG